MNKISSKWPIAAFALTLCMTPLIFAGDYDRDGIPDAFDRNPTVPNGVGAGAPMAPGQGMNNNQYKQQKAEMKAQKKAQKKANKQAKKQQKQAYKAQKKADKQAMKQQKQAYKA